METYTTIPSKRIHWREMAQGAIIFLCVLLFVYTATDKLLNYDRFTFQMALVPSPLVQSLASVLGWVVPIAELLIVALLVIESTSRIGLWASLLLMAIFEGYIIWMKSTGLDLPCTCGGIVSSMGWTTHVVFNAVIILLLAIAVRLSYHRKNKPTVYS